MIGEDETLPVKSGLSVAQNLPQLLLRGVYEAQRFLERLVNLNRVVVVVRALQGVYGVNQIVDVVQRGGGRVRV